VKGFDLTGWYGVFMPAGTPQDIIARLHQETVKTLAMPDVRQRLAADGAEVVGNSPREFDKFVRSELVKWAKVVKLSGAKPE
jgi:tripartite-type tricarboxylate transporter receptor subunit TctC